MELKKNERVYFSNGHSEGWLEACWSTEANAFYTVIGIDGEKVKIFSTDVRTVDKKGKKFVPNAKNCTVEIFPEFETEKAFAIPDGDNGLVGKANKAYYKYIAKNVCFCDNGKIFAPKWAV